MLSLSPRRALLWGAVVGLLGLGVAPGSLRAQDDGETRGARLPSVLDEDAVRGLCRRYERTESWALRALILTSLGSEWHPCGKTMLVSALSGRDLRLKAFAVEALRRSDPDLLRLLADREFMDLLVRKEAQRKSGLYPRRILDLLAQVAPQAEARTPAEWNRWWSRQRDDWVPGEWTLPTLEHGARPRTGSYVQRAFELRERGLELTLCIDSSGSMQPTIDAVRDALEGVVQLLESIAPDFRVGLVHYRDYGDFSEGAQVLETLTSSVSRVQRRLDRLRAEGGGDIPERVECGLVQALDRRKMGWKLQTEKLVVVLGDAPPHHAAIERCVSLARDAHRHPFARNGARTGGIPPRPFTVSTIGVGTHHVTDSTRRSFGAIARAGGGAYVELLSMDPDEEAHDPAQAVLRHILELAFGPRWSGQLELFLSTYQEYRADGGF